MTGPASTARSDDAEYDYRPALSAETGDQVRVRSQERPGIRILKVATSRVGEDGLREELKKLYGLKDG